MLRTHAMPRPGRTGVLLLVMASFAIALAVALAVGGSVYRALHRAARSAQAAGQLAFSLQALDPASNRAAVKGFEPVASRPQYSSGAFFAGDLYVAGANGLSRIAPDGRSTLELRSGIELPAAPIVGVASGRLRGATEPQLFLATAGAGLIILQPRPPGQPGLQQLLATDLEARDLTAVLPLPGGSLLLGTRHRGLLLYDGSHLSRQALPIVGIDSARLQITALAAIDAASFLVGTRSSGVFFVRGGVVQQANAASGLPDDQVESIAVVNAHAFVGTPSGTAVFNLAAATPTLERTLLPGVFSHALAVDAGRLLVGTIDQGVQEVSLDQRASLHRIALFSESATASRQRIDAFLAGPGELYALGDGQLLHRDGARWTPILPTSAAALTDRDISALAFSPDGTLYIGFFDRGLDLLSPQGVVRHLEDDHLFCINRLVLDPVRRTMAAATGDGLVLFDAQGTPRQTLTRRDGLISDHVTDIAFTSNGTALATPAGITFLGPSSPESLYAFQGLVNNHVYALAAPFGATDPLMAGTLGGLSLLKARAVQRSFTVNNSTLGHNWITALLPLPQATTLLGTYGAGLETLDAQGRFTPVDLPSGAPRDLVINPNALFATATHRYAGTLGYGMLVYSEATGRWSAVTKGLPSLNVTSFAARDGELYVGTDNGLVRIAEANLP